MQDLRPSSCAVSVSTLGNCLATAFSRCIQVGAVMPDNTRHAIESRVTHARTKRRLWGDGTSDEYPRSEHLGSGAASSLLVVCLRHLSNRLAL